MEYSPDRKYNIIYADPPWRYKSWSLAEKHYSTMSLEDIKKMNIPSADDCALFLWVTCPFLKEGLEVISAWGFHFKTVAFVWVKMNKRSNTPFWGLGNWTRSNAEFCLFGVKGKPKRIKKNVHQIVMAKIREHSRKPDEVRERIVELMGDVPRLELFARECVEGWDMWGHQTNKYNNGGKSICVLT